MSFYNRNILEKKKELIIDRCEYNYCYNPSNIEIINGQEEKLRYCYYHWKFIKGYFRGVKCKTSS